MINNMTALSDFSSLQNNDFDREYQNNSRFNQNFKSYKLNKLENDLVSNSKMLKLRISQF